MITESVEKLFCLACSTPKFPENFSSLIKMAHQFCRLNSLVWGLEPTDDDCDFSFWVMPKSEAWIISCEDPDPSYCVIFGIAQAYNNLGPDLTERVVDLERYRRMRK